VASLKQPGRAGVRLRCDPVGLCSIRRPPRLQKATCPKIYQSMSKKQLYRTGRNELYLNLRHIFPKRPV